MHKREENINASVPAPLVLLLHCCIGIVLSIILLFISAILISAEALPSSAIEVIAAVTAFSGVFVSSFLSAKKFGRAIISALLQGLIFLFFLYIIGAIFFARFIPANASLPVFLACIFGSVSGGIISVCGKKRKH